MSAPLSSLIAEAKAIFGDNATLTDAEQMKTYTQSMRHRTFHPSPLVLFPKNVQEVAQTIQLCRKHKVPCIPQGGNTGLVDGGLPREGKDEVIVNLSRMNKIRDIDQDGMIATVEAGVVLQTLRETLSELNLMFPLSIASEGSAEIGGLLSTNAGGLAALRYGTMRNLVLGVEVVLPNGEIISTLKNIRKDNTGYHLTSNFVGAEGTLGIVTAASLQLLPATHNRVTAVAALADFPAAMQLFKSLRNECVEHLSAYEFISTEALRLLMKNIANARFPQSDNAAYYALIELSATSTRVPLGDMLEVVLGGAMENGQALDAVIAESETQSAQFWEARESIPAALRTEKQRLHFDIAVPVKSLSDFTINLGREIKVIYPDLVLMPFGHIGDGNIHYNMYLSTPIADDAFATLKQRVQDMVFAKVHEWQGSISAEHGVGVERKAVLAKVKSVAELDTMRAIKRAIDPEGMMNPGKIFD